MRKLIAVGCFALISLSAGSFNNRFAQPEKQTAVQSLNSEIDHVAVKVDSLLIKLKTIQ